MNRTKKFLVALNDIWLELPGLVGADWQEFESELLEYLEQFKSSTVNHTITRALCIDLFTKYPSANEALTKALSRVESSHQEIVTKGVGIRSMPEMLSRLLHPVVVRYTDISCPNLVSIDAPRFTVVVRMTTETSALSVDPEALSVHQNLPLLVRVDAPSFDVLNKREQEVLIIPEQDSLPLVFDLRPLRIGHARINFDFLQSGNPVGTASVPIEVRSNNEPVGSDSHEFASLHIETNVEPPYLMLYISYEHHREEQSLSFTLFQPGEVGITFPPLPLLQDPKSQADHLYKSLTLLTAQAEPTIHVVANQQRIIPAEDVDRRIKQFGQNLWRELIPSEFKDLFLSKKESWIGKTLLIVSDEPYIPWELIWPYEDSGWEATGPWCETMRLTRWLRRDAKGNGHPAPPAQLRIRSLACFAPTDSGLPSAQDEQLFLQTFANNIGARNVSPSAPTWSNVLDLLESVDYDWIHVAAHGTFYAETPSSHSAIWLEGQRPLTPDSIVGPQIEGHINKARPSFVMNACHSGRQAWTITQLGGWANRLISNGTSLFLAPLWTVTDSLALIFAKNFYQSLLLGDTVAEATQKSRMAARRSGDPSWLAYSVYSHPNARLTTPNDN